MNARQSIQYELGHTISNKAWNFAINTIGNEVEHTLINKGEISNRSTYNGLKLAVEFYERHKELMKC